MEQHSNFVATYTFSDINNMQKTKTTCNNNNNINNNMIVYYVMYNTLL